MAWLLLAWMITQLSKSGYFCSFWFNSSTINKGEVEGIEVNRALLEGVGKIKLNQWFSIPTLPHIPSPQ
ncbi:MAG: hypothetical protein AB4060_01310 [Crocosphaera sp.]